MRVCLVSVEIFAWGKYGGFGRATRIIGRELARRGVEVTAVVPRREGQRSVEDLDGIRVLSFRSRDLLSASQLYKEADAEIYHSQEPSLGTYLAARAMPDRKHVVTFRDPRDAEDWRIEFRLPSLNPAQVVANWLYEDNWLVKRAARQSDAKFAAAKVLIPKARTKYRLKSAPEFLPTPVDVPSSFRKAETPTVCFLSRWDKRKRPEIFFELPKAFPQVRFLAAGKSRNPEYDTYLHSTYGGLPNLEMLGFIDQFKSDQLSQLLGQSWIMVNTAAREGLPNAFIEAAAHGCAILSAVDPDGFASRFGYQVKDDNFAQGLEALLKDNNWKKQGDLGYSYVSEVFSLDKAIDRHLSIYENLTGIQRPSIPEVEKGN
jgi:glycosyltransferase involved in cell wall biosynthesis